VGHHSTRLNDDFALRAAAATEQSRGTMSPRYTFRCADRRQPSGCWVRSLLKSVQYNSIGSQSGKGVGLTLESQVADLEALVRALLGRDDRGVADQRVVDTRVWNQVGLKLIQVDIKSAIET
jgi:hypothetical protein